MDRLRILLVSGASQVGRSVMEALAGRRSCIELAATGSVAEELSMFDFDAAYLMPETARDPEGFAGRLLDIARDENPDLLVPCRDDDVLALARLGERYPELAPRLLSGSAAAAEVMADKWSSAEFSVRQGLPYAPSVVSRPGMPVASFVREHGFPLLAKPRRGHASRGVWLVQDEVQLRRALAREGYMVQKWLGEASAVEGFGRKLVSQGIPVAWSFEGRMRSAQALIAPDGSIAQCVATQAAMRFGHSRCIEADDDERVRAIGVRAAQALSMLGWRGPLNVQCQETEAGELYIHEFNGRFTGASAARRLLGRDEVGLAVELFTGRCIEGEAGVPAAHAGTVGRVPVPLAPNARRVAALMRDGAWRRG